MVAVSVAGRSALLWLAIGLVVAILRPSLAAAVWQMALALGLTMLAVDVVVKPRVARVRPYEMVADIRVLGVRPTTQSFPSGHAASSAAAAFALVRLTRRRTLRLLVWGLALVVGFSRVYVGVHYPLDVAGGIVVGLLCSAFVVARSPWIPGR
jgi:undecaprenyl-diphosphatase